MTTFAFGKSSAVATAAAHGVNSGVQKRVRQSCRLREFDAMPPAPPCIGVDH